MEETSFRDSRNIESTVDQQLKVLYIAGEGRSGSTILGNILSQIDGFFSVGEMHHIWDRGFIENWRCSCGATFSLTLAICEERDRYAARPNAPEALIEMPTPCRP